MPDLRKRKATGATGPPRTKEARLNSINEISGRGTSSTDKPTVGDLINLDDIGGEIETNDGVKVTLKLLVDRSKNGVVLFTYPKASTPGCTTQACLFRDDYVFLTTTGFSIYGLSADSPKSNTTFKTKQNLPYTLLCDPKATLIAAIGMKKSPSATARGVFVVDKCGKVLAATQGGPAATVNVVRQLIEANEGENLPIQVTSSRVEGAQDGVLDKGLVNDAENQTESEHRRGDEDAAEIAAEVADTAERLHQ